MTFEELFGDTRSALGPALRWERNHHQWRAESPHCHGQSILCEPSCSDRCECLVASDRSLVHQVTIYFEMGENQCLCNIYIYTIIYVYIYTYKYNICMLWPFFWTHRYTDMTWWWMCVITRILKLVPHQSGSVASSVLQRGGSGNVRCNTLYHLVFHMGMSQYL